MNKLKSYLENSSTRVILVSTFLGGILLRILFFNGITFSDDNYYTFLTILKFFPDLTDTGYIGYPVFQLRIGHLFITALSYYLFGINEISSIIFPFIFSALNILLIFKTTLLLFSDKKAALISSFILTILPTEVIFASISFPDLINISLLNLATLFLILALYREKIFYSICSGILILISFLFKEYGIYYVTMYFTLMIYFLSTNSKKNKFIIIPLLSFILYFAFEGITYYLLKGDIFYRFTVLKANFQYCYYDFFPYKSFSNQNDNFYYLLVKQIFNVNLKLILFRRFYLFIPLAAFILSFFYFKKKEALILIIWFFALLIGLIALPTSIDIYRPLDLTRNWYVMPLFFPSVIIVSVFLSGLNKYFIRFLLSALFIFSLVMCFEYQTFFQTQNLKEFKNWLKQNPQTRIYTDHFTKYSIDIIKEYKNQNSVIRLNNNGIKDINTGDIVIINPKVMTELSLQKNYYETSFLLDTCNFSLFKRFNDYFVYKKIN